MAGTLTISTLSDGTNSTSSTNCIQGSAKAWVNYNGTSATVRRSYNVSSVTRTASGQYAVNFTNAMADANYATVTTSSAVNNAVYGKFSNIVGVTGTTVTPTTTSVTVFSSYTTGAFNEDYISVAIFS
jgi:fructose-specific component phosphotransferase system IIB-like protein